jgi:intracellular sulfur oxidation DsrE/DsrF family protein
MKKTNSRGWAVACLLMTLGALSLSACATGTGAKPKAEEDRSLPGTVWINPVIEHFGRVHPRPDAAVQPDPAADYKVIVDVIHGSKNPAEVYGSLERLARIVNLMGYAKVPPEHVHIVAVIEGEATLAAASNPVYRKFHKVDNPNAPIIHALKQAGVTLLVCGQALAENGFKDSDVNPDVTVSLSALSDFVVYGQRGYSYMQL